MTAEPGEPGGERPGPETPTPARPPRRSAEAAAREAASARTRRRRFAAAVLLVLGLVLRRCAAAPERPLRRGDAPPPTRVFEMARANRGREPYSAWFADRAGDVLYFGLSPFWDLLDSGGPAADLREPGDQLIGRFDLAHERFLPPLRVGALAPDLRASVWDVLAHSSGLVCYTAFFDAAGCADPLSGAVRHFSPALGPGLNELSEGPAGNLYVTRYGAAGGAVLVLTPAGLRLAEFELSPSALGIPAAKSVAVDPRSGEIWVNTDTFDARGGIHHEQLRLAPDGAQLERYGSPELLFMRFDARGRGWFVEAEAGALQVRVREDGRERARAALGPRAPFDYAQDIAFSQDGTAAVAFWSGRVLLLRLEAGRIAVRSLRLEPPPRCAPPRRALLYSAVLVAGMRVYGTLACGAVVLSQQLVPSAHAPSAAL